MTSQLTTYALRLHNSSTLRFHPFIPHHTNFLKFSAAFNISENKLVNKFKAKIEVWSKKKPKLLLTKGFDFEKLKN
jgi:hypothetical protein